MSHVALDQLSSFLFRRHASPVWYLMNANAVVCSLANICEKGYDADHAGDVNLLVYSNKK